MKSKEVGIGTAMYILIKLYLGEGYKDISSKRRSELLNNMIASFNKTGKIEIDQEDYDMILEKIFYA